MTGVPDWLDDRLIVFPSAVAGEVCDRIAAVGDALPVQAGPLYDEKTRQRYFDPDVRLTKVAWLHAHDWVFDVMHGFAARANAGWGFDLTVADPLQFAIYRRNDFFDWHKDMLRIRKGAIRKVSVVLQLTPPESYRGGRLEFLDNDFGVFVPDSFVPQGSVAVFASLLKHRVTPVKDGERRSLTAWFKGPPFR